MLAAAIAAVSVAGCAATTYEKLAGYEVPPQTQPVPTQFPNVFTSVKRDDNLMSDAAKENVVKDMEKARDTHVAETSKSIEKR